MKYILLLLFVFAGHTLSAQEDESPVRLKQEQDSILKRPQSPRQAKRKTRDSITIKDYKIISHSRDTVALDTSITIQKEYKFNFLRKDDFELNLSLISDKPIIVWALILNDGIYIPF